MRKSAAAVLMLLTIAPLFAQEAPNPFTASGARPREGAIHAMTSGVSAFLANVMAPVQRSLNESLSVLTRSLEGSRSLGGLLFVVLISLAYGLFHAAGPGHGKTIVSSYFLANEARVRHSFIVGYMIAIVHALAALAVVLILSFVIHGLFSTGIETANHYIQLVTFAVIALIGLFLLVARIRGSEHHHLHLGGHHAHDEQDHEGEAAQRITLRRLAAIAVPAGVIPCPGAVAIVLFALSMNMIGVSIISVVAISIGMGLTISVTGTLVILAKKGAVRIFAGPSGQGGSTARRVIEIGGAAVLFLFGIVFFLAQV
jgi:nickel/cobalt transporter (NicO) family protein